MKSFILIIYTQKKIKGVAVVLIEELERIFGANKSRFLKVVL
jgi:hypothetical protein